jgi:hypothetical protein
MQLERFAAIVIWHGRWRCRAGAGHSQPYKRGRQDQAATTSSVAGSGWVVGHVLYDGPRARWVLFGQDGAAGSCLPGRLSMESQG